jgi:hypothetical protein
MVCVKSKVPPSAARGGGTAGGAFLGGDGAELTGFILALF